MVKKTPARAPRTTVHYELKTGHKVVYRGITNDPERRAVEHQNDGKKFSHMTVVSPPRSRERAENEETEKIQKYQETHNGKGPKYNKNKLS
jgi:predicted GIY-YIG superfamily endonuclease